MARKILPDDKIKQLVTEGHTDTEIARYLREHENIAVTRQAIGAWRHRNAIDRPKRAFVMSMPWALRDEHSTLEAARAIRWYGRREAGLPLDPEELHRLQKVEAHLRSVDGVLHYEPSTPAGFVIVPRRPGVDLGIVREP